MNHRLVRITAVAVLAAGISVSAAKAADGRYRDFVIGERAAGMGGAAIAVAQSVDAVFYNPAGLTDTERDSLSLSANLYGFQMFRQRSALYPGEDASGHSFIAVPSAMGGVYRLGDEWVGGFGVFSPDYDRVNIIVSKANGQHLYTYSDDDMSLWVGPAIGWQPAGSAWSFGLSVFGIYRSEQISQTRYHEESGMMSDAYDCKDLGLTATLGAQYDFGGGWKAGATVQSPNLHVFGFGKHSASILGGEGTYTAGGYSDDVETDNRRSLQLALGLGKTVPGQYAFALDVVYHASSDYDLMEWDFGNSIGKDTERVEMDDVVDVSLGGEYYVAEHWPLRAGVFTAFSGVDVPDDPYGNEILTTDMDMYGLTFSIGRETDVMAVNLGFEYAFGHGHTLGYTAEDEEGLEQGETACRGDRLFVSLSTSYYF